MWFMKLSQLARQAAGKRCTYLPRPPPLPDPSSSSFRWLIVSYCVQPSLAASTKAVLLSSYFKTCCYTLFVSGVVSCGMLVIPIGLAWLVTHLGTMVRGLCWLMSPLVSKNVEGLLEVGGRLLLGVEKVHNVGVDTLQVLYRLEAIIYSTNLFNISHPALLACLSLVGILFASLPASTSLLHIVYIALLLQVWLRLSYLWQAAESQSGPSSQPPPLPDPQPSRRARRLQQKHCVPTSMHGIDPRLSRKLLGQHWKNFVWKCWVLVLPVLHALIMCKHQLLARLLTFETLVDYSTVLTAVQLTCLFVGGWISRRCSACLWDSLWTRLNRYSNGAGHKEWYTHVNNRGRESIRLKVHPNIPAWCRYFRLRLLVFSIWFAAWFLAWTVQFSTLYVWLDFLRHVNPMDSNDTGGSVFTLAGCIDIVLSSMLRRGLLVLRFGVWYLWSIPWRWKLFLQDLRSKHFTDDMLSIFDSLDNESDEEKSWLGFDSIQSDFKSMEEEVSCFKVELIDKTKASEWTLPPVDVGVRAAFSFSWRLKRRMRNVSKVVSKKVDKLASAAHIACSPHPPSPSSMNAFSTATDATPADSTYAFLASFNPALAGLRLLYIEREEVKPQVVRKKHRVSIELRSCYKRILTRAFDLFVLPALMEEVYNSIGGKEIPLIMDTGASCCISPCREDFVSYKKSTVKIKDLSSSNSVAGEGMIRWKVLDAQGRSVTIDIPGYHVPHASVRLLSPQSLLQVKSSGGGKAGMDLVKFHMELGNGIVLHAPFGHANLPILPMANDCGVFGFSTSDKGTFQQMVRGYQELNLTSAQRELLHWHNKLSHAGLSTIHNLCRQKKTPKLKNADELVALLDTSTLQCKKHIPSDACDGLLCLACETAKATRRKPGIKLNSKPTQHGSLRPQDIQPGDCISCDHYGSPSPGRVIAESGYSSTRYGYVGGTIFVDNASGWMFHKPQKSISASDTIRSKLLLEREAADVGRKIRKLHSDNGVFNSKEFRAHCKSLRQKLTFCGVGAHHQNGIAENAIRTVCNMARANMLHATVRWPERSLIDCWPLAMSYAIWVHNRLPPHGYGLSPLEVWSGVKNRESELPRAHVWGCPVYVLDPALQDGKKIPKWDSRARQGIFVGFSDEHSSLVPLIFNPRTQHISPQYHVIFDDKFTTIPSMNSVEERDVKFEKLFETESESFVEEEDLQTTRTLLDDEWLSPEDLADKNSASQPSLIDSDDEADDDLSFDAGERDSEGAPEGVPEGGIQQQLQPPPINPLPPPTPPQANLPPPAPSPPTTSPRYPRRENTGNWKDGPAKDRSHGRWLTGLTCLLALPGHALSAVREWGQPPMTVSNVGCKHGPVFASLKVDKVHVREVAMFEDEWSDVGKSIFNGDIAAFSSYLQADLSDEVDCLVADIEPHILQAKLSKSDPDNPTWSQAMRSVDSDKWWNAMEVEIQTLETELQAWRLVKKEPWMNILPCTWAFKIKRFPDGSINKFKARFCVRGDMQKEGIDFWETWSPVVQWSTVRTMMILSTKLGLCTAQADITAAFVHADLAPGEQIFVRQPPGFNRGNDLVLSLRRSVYGLKQAPRYFFKHLSSKLEGCGLMQSSKDPCLFVGKDVIAVIYVDDVLFYSKSDDAISAVIQKLKDGDIAIRREKDAAGFLGIDISSVDASSNQLLLTQTGLTKRIVEALGLCSKFSTKVDTPAEAAPLPKDVNGEPAHGTINFAATVGMLLYLSGHSRPDIAFAVHQCARYTFKPTRRHELALIRIGRYLKGTMAKGMILSPTDSPQVDCYPDADFAGLYGHENSQDPHCARSRTGYVITAFGCPVLWKSRLQTEIALSTMEAEYVALSTACKDLFPIVDMVQELASAVGIDVEAVANMHVKIHEDNVGALTLAGLEPRRMTPRSKHYAIKYHWFREHVHARRIKLVKIGTADQLGDLFTKGLTKTAFRRLRVLLMGW